MDTRRGARERDGITGGVILMVLGVLFLAQQFFAIDVWHYAWPLALIAVGIGLLVRHGLRQPGP